MSNQMVILDALPDAAEFYSRYWNKRPFVARAAIPTDIMAGLITGDELAGLSIEDGPQSRMIKTAGKHQDWSCNFGPFSEEDFTQTGDKDWSLLVQNIDQFHPETASLLGYFNFAPRWMMDDIMVSYSAPGGSVGPHVDSYHVFLVQGQGKRSWKVGHAPLEHETYIEGLELKVLKEDIDGDEVEVICGDVLYLPPRFAHEGTTLDDALTFSVGFLGPKLSELYISYGQYLSELEENDHRYVGQDLDASSAGFTISPAAVDTLNTSLSRQLDTPNFTQWLVEFFTEATHEDFGTYALRDDSLTLQDFEDALKGGAAIFKPPYVKFALSYITSDLTDNSICLGVENHSYILNNTMKPLVHNLMNEATLNTTISPELFNLPANLDFLLELYNHQALEFIE